MINNELVIDAKELTKQFNGKIAVDHVSLQVKKGEIFGFLGPNGSGKTTTIRMICGLLTPDSGAGYCLNYDLIKDSAIIRRHVGYMTQKFSLYEDLTIRENLNFVAGLYELKNVRRNVNEAIEKLGLENRQHQLAGKLSGGWKQRLALAAALLHKPKLLLLDEPTAGVDPKARRDFWDQLHHLSAQGITTLVTTHYMDEAERCHRLAYIASGKLLVHGTIEEISKEIQLYTWLVTGKNLMALADKLKQSSAVDQVVAFGNGLHVSGRSFKALEKTIEQYQLNEYTWEAIPSSIEDIFIHLVDEHPGPVEE